MKKNKTAFTMIELVFVIVILGILASVAIPRLTSTRTDAVITKGRADISSIRSAIVTERQARLIRGESDYIAGTSINTGGLFGGVLMYAVASGTDDGEWSATGTTDANTSSYNFKVSGVNVVFTYTRGDGKFTCNTANATYGTKCSSLIN